MKDKTLDQIAIFLSGLCLVHCLAVPVALVLGSVFSEWLVETETNVHWILLALAAPVSLWAFRRGFRDHPSYLTLGAGLVGLLLMLLGVSHVIGESWEIGLTVVGVTGVLYAHIRNAMARAHRHSH
ncbi:MAG: MerC domain-containing protein [Pseudomonadales bacterium]